MLQQQQQQGQQGPQQMAQGPQQMAPGPQQPQEGIGSMMPAPDGLMESQEPDGFSFRAYGIGSWFQKKIMDPIGKGLHELTPDELIDLDEWMEDKAQKWGGAYGGIAGADGRRAYGIGSWWQKKVMDPIKKNWKPIAAVGAGLALDRWGIPRR